MNQFDSTEQNLTNALRAAKFSEGGIDDFLEAFRSCRKMVADLLPLRGVAQNIQDKILTPVGEVIKTSSKTNERFGWVGIVFGVVGIFFSVAPHLGTGLFDPTRDLAAKVDNLRVAMTPATHNAEIAKAKILIYDTFDGVDMPYYEVEHITDVGNVGKTFGYGYDSIGFQPAISKVLAYKPIAVDCVKGCRLAVEAMVKLGQNMDIRQKQIDDHTYEPILPVKIEYQTANGNDWRDLDPVMEYLKVPWFAKSDLALRMRIP